MTEQQATVVGPVDSANRLDADGYALLRGAIPADWLDELRDAFDAGVLANDQWPVPRGTDWRHALLDLNPRVQAVCRLPILLATAGAVIRERFFLAQVEGREPMPGGGHQGLHRDFCAQRAGDTVLAIVFLDDYGPENGATRVVPGSHRILPEAALPGFEHSLEAMQLAGRAGDVLVFEADLVHAGSLNISGARRRSLLISYFAAPVYDSHLSTAPLRNIRMDAAWFEPAPTG
ncbi:phytanoyl-CoA dioxygenase family protein [Arenimonas alkanexedens]